MFYLHDLYSRTFGTRKSYSHAKYTIETNIYTTRTRTITIKNQLPGYQTQHAEKKQTFLFYPHKSLKKKIVLPHNNQKQSLSCFVGGARCCKRHQDCSFVIFFDAMYVWKCKQTPTDPYTNAEST